MTKAVPRLRYRSSSREGVPAPVPASSNAPVHPDAAEAGPMVHPGSVWAPAVPASNRGTSTTSSRYRSPPLRQPLMLSPGPSTTTQMPPAPVVGLPPPGPMRSRSPSAELEADSDSDGSSSYVSTDSDDDHLHGYATPVPKTTDLFICESPFGGLVCPVCPNRKAHGWDRVSARQHVLAMAKMCPDETTTSRKYISRHCALARNEQWMV